MKYLRPFTLKRNVKSREALLKIMYHMFHGVQKRELGIVCDSEGLERF